MTWEERRFKGKDRVWIQTENGTPVEENGKVFMKYSNSEDAKIYRAALANVQTSSAQSKPKPSNSAKRGVDRLVWKTPKGEVIFDTEKPEGLENQTPIPAELWEFHTDGACAKNPGPCGWGWVLRHQDEYLEARQFIGHGTNNIAEFLAIKAALDHVKDDAAKVRIYTDSQLAIGIFTQNWKAKENVELVDAVKQAYKRFKKKPELIKIKGHAGHLLNERADFQATQSIKD